MPVIFIFIDGVGLGLEEESNPFFATKTPFLTDLLEGRSLTREASGKEYAKVSLLGLDATLGVKGLPQSATGQTSLFTGVNAAGILGRHLNGFPNQILREILAEKGMFLQLQAKSLKGTFANAYRPVFFKELKEGIKRHFSCSTLITYYGGLGFRDLDDLRNAQAVYLDITNKSLREKGFQVPLVSPQEAGKRLVNISRSFDLTLYEHFITDIAGHSGDYNAAAEAVTILDAFLGSVAENMNPERDIVLVSSDHGNLENIDVKVHTANPVPALVMGKRRHKLVTLLAKGEDITGVFPALLEVLSDGTS
jgi:hypothetical protein